MQENQFAFEYELYDDISELNSIDASLVQKAREMTENAYAPYSKFHVAAAALLENGNMVTGTNQENASYPVGICAERVLLGSVGSQFPNMPIQTLAVSYKKEGAKNSEPISPCGMCRQSLLEYENRTNSPIRIILAGQEGNIIILKSAKLLLPFAFTGKQL